MENDRVKLFKETSEFIEVNFNFLIICIIIIFLNSSEYCFDVVIRHGHLLCGKVSTYYLINSQYSEVFYLKMLLYFQ